MGEQDSWWESLLVNVRLCCIVLDLYFWRGPGLSMSARQDRQLVAQALLIAVWWRRGVVHRSITHESQVLDMASIFLIASFTSCLFVSIVTF